MGGRSVVVGDFWQSLYGFRGADPRSFERIRAMLQKHGRKVTDLDLPINYRCDQAIIERAQTLVPDIQGASKARGTVDSLTFQEAIERANNQMVDIVLPDGVDGAERGLPLPGKESVSFAFLCRINLPLVMTAYQLIGMDKKVCIIGRNQIGAPLKAIINDLCGTDPNHPEFTDRLTDLKDTSGNVIQDGFLTRLDHYFLMQSEKLQDEKYEAKLEALQQNVECLEVIADKVKDNRVQGLRDEIDELFQEEPTPGVISLSTVHRAKGLEWDVVFILRPDLLPHPRAKSPDQMQQEKNAQYVAYTRARNRLYEVRNWPFGKGKSTLNWEAPVAKTEQPVYIPPTESPAAPAQEWVDNGQAF